MKGIKIPKGVFDILPTDPDTKSPWKQSHLWQYLEAIIRKHTHSYGYKEIRTPIFESTDLFKRSVGESSDIVTKEMYTFEDKGGRSLTLRPEGTAAVMRAIIEKNLAQNSAFHKYFYIGPCFRYERPQAGRYRQHHQLGIEAIGVGSAEQDVEVIDLAFEIYKELGLKNLTLHLNSLGDPEHRQAFKEALIKYFTPYASELSEDSQRRLDSNPLRILDSKASQDQQFIKNAPNILDFVSGEAKDHFKEVQDLLSTLEIPFEINSQLVRGLDYYNRTVFEITSGALGAQNSVGGGGRYDGLLPLLGGPDVPSVGFATGLERVLQTLINEEVSLPSPSCPSLFLIPLGDEAKKTCFTLTHELRRYSIYTEMAMGQKKLKAAMKHANAQKAKFVAVVGETELKEQSLLLKRMEDGYEEKIPLSLLKQFLIGNNHGY